DVPHLGGGDAPQGARGPRPGRQAHGPGRGGGGEPPRAERSGAVLSDRDAAGAGHAPALPGPEQGAGRGGRSAAGRLLDRRGGAVVSAAVGTFGAVVPARAPVNKW